MNVWKYKIKYQHRFSKIQKKKQFIFILNTGLNYNNKASNGNII